MRYVIAPSSPVCARGALLWQRISRSRPLDLIPIVASYYCFGSCVEVPFATLFGLFFKGKLLGVSVVYMRVALLPWPGTWKSLRAEL